MYQKKCSTVFFLLMFLMLFIGQLQASVLILLAHPDDETWLNGTIAQLSQTEQIHLVYATSGGAGKDRTSLKRKGNDLANARETESICAAKQLNAQTHFLRFDDKNLELYEAELTEQYQHLYQQLTPRLIISFAFDGITGHDDHIFIANTAKKYWLKHAKATSEFWQVVVSDTRAQIAQKIADEANYPHPIRKPVATTEVSININVSLQAKQRIDAFACYPSQFPDGLQTIWRSFVEQAAYEEFIKFTR